MRLRYTHAAAKDRERIAAYLRAHAPEIVPRLTTAIETALQRLLDYPEMGFSTDIPEVRVIFVSRFHYKIFYRVRDDIEILRVPAHSYALARYLRTVPFGHTLGSCYCGIRLAQMLISRAQSQINCSNICGPALVTWAVVEGDVHVAFAESEIANTRLWDQLSPKESKVGFSVINWGYGAT